MKNCVICVLVVVFVEAGCLMDVAADEIDDVLGLEVRAEAESKAMQETGNTIKVPEQDQVQSETAVTAGENPTLTILSRNELEMELTAARAEVKRLKDIVRRILAANRREKESMHYNIGCVFKAAGQYRKAEQSFLAALALSPSDPAVHYNLGILYDEDLNRSDKAKKHYQAFLDLAPGDEDAGRVYQWLTALE